MPAQVLHHTESQSGSVEFYRNALRALNEAEVPFLVGGGYSLEIHTRIRRRTKDLDLFVHPGDWRRVLDVLSAAGFRTEVTYPHWLVKAFQDEHLIDIIFNSGNGVCPVDAEWFKHALDETFLDQPVRICPAEEMIWQKAFIMERNRYDGADISHLLRACGERFDWSRVLRRFGKYWRVLLSHLVLYGFVYPSERWRVPDWVLQELMNRFQTELQGNNGNGNRQCRGTLLSLKEYCMDLEHWGYADARLVPWGNLTQDEIDQWMTAFHRNEAI